jgi:uncharacterized protein (TIGR00251 family)
MPQAWYHWQGEALILNLRVQPRASRNAVAGPHGNQLKIHLTAAPVDGKANSRLLKLLAGVFGVPNSRVELLSGFSSRSKRIRIIRPRRPRRLPDSLEAPEM